MATTTSKQVTSYYEQFSQVNITFNKQVMDALGLVPKEVYLKCKGDIFPCLVYATSMVGARVVAKFSSSHFEKIREANNRVSLRFAFKTQENKAPLSFFVPAKVQGFNPFDKRNPSAHMVSLTYMQKPADDLIIILGELIETQAASDKRRDERIVITPESKKELGLYSTVADVNIDSESRNCIIRDLSFSGTKILLVGASEVFVNKSATLQFSMGSRDDLFEIPGKIVRYEEVVGRDDIAAIAVQFEAKSIPMIYKMRLNAYLKNKQQIKR